MAHLKRQVKERLQNYPREEENTGEAMEKEFQEYQEKLCGKEEASLDGKEHSLQEQKAEEKHILQSQKKISQ